MFFSTIFGAICYNALITILRFMIILEDHDSWDQHLATSLLE